MEDKRLIRKNESLIKLAKPYRHLHLFGVDKGYHIPSHQHDFYHVNTVLEGAIRITTHQQERLFTAGTVYIVPSQVPHEFYCPDHCLQLGIDVLLEEEPRQITQLLIATFPTHEVTPVTVLSPQKLRPAPELFHDYSPSGYFRTQHFMDSVLIAAIDRYQSFSATDDFKQRFLRYMGEEQVFLHSVTQIAQDLAISKTHLEREVNRHFGTSVKKYCDQIRLTLLCQKLEHTTATQREIAEELGFYDESHLTNFFKRQLGITPKAYRRSLQ